MARGALGIRKRVERQEKKIIQMTEQLEKEKEILEKLLQEQKEEDAKVIYEAIQKSKRSYQEIMNYLEGKADI